MSKEIIINAELAEEVRIAILEKGRLVDLDIETATKAKHKGNIYKGIISNIEDGLEAAFVEIGEERQAFLPLSEIRPSLYPSSWDGKKKLKVSDLFIKGQEIVVQVTKDEIGNKGAAVSTYLSLPGRYVVLMHSDESGGGISRKIESDAARSAAREMLSRLSVPEHMAVIIRTAGMTGSKADLLRDFQILCESWNQIDKGAQIGRAPTLLYREPEIVIRTIRDYFSPDVKKIVIDDEEEFEDALSYFREWMPDLVELLERHRKKDPIFQYYGIEKAISELFELEVSLQSGGSITIEQTEALVSIDVNSGSSTKEEDHEATVYKTNLEAADEIARQLRLRDMGGIVVIDFIDMASRWHRRDVEKKLKELMKQDKARVKLGRISDNGTLELTRQRIRQSHSMISRIKCQACRGTGRIRDTQGLALNALRKISGLLAKKRVPLAKLKVTLPVDVANTLNNSKRREILQLCENYEMDIAIIGNIKLANDEMEFIEERRGYAGLRTGDNSPFSFQKDANKKRGAVFSSSDIQKLKALKLPPLTIGPAPIIIEEEFFAEDEGDSFNEDSNEALQSGNDLLLEALFGQVSKAHLKELLSLKESHENIELKPDDDGEDLHVDLAKDEVS